MKNRVIVILLSVFSLTSCTQFKTSSTPKLTAQNPLVPITGSYCTLSPTGAISDSSSFSLICLQSNNTWQSVGGVIDQSTIYWAHLSKASNGDVLVGYTFNDGGSDLGFKLQKYTATNGWSQVGSNLVNGDSSGNRLPAYSQFGATYAEFQNNYFSFWTDSSSGYLGYLNSAAGIGGAWTKTVIPTAGNPNNDVLVRHPEIFQTNSKIYFYYGEPAPTVWDVSSGVPVAMGSPTTVANEYTLYTALAFWSGDLVMAYTSSNFPTTQNWVNVTDQIKIAFHSSKGWNTVAGTPQDTPGHDGVTPYLFVNNGNLFVMYSDYTTEGLPRNSQKIFFHMRVKQWNGTQWLAVGSESPLVYLSQRFEYLQEGNSILFTAVVPSASGVGYDRVMMAWQAGVFSQVGPALNTSMNSYWIARPGSVIRWN